MASHHSSRIELSVPVNRDRLTFEDRQRQIFDDIQHEMDDRRRQWEGDVERMRNDFFKTSMSTGFPSQLDASNSLSSDGAYRTVGSAGLLPAPPPLSATINDEATTWFEPCADGTAMWKARFNLHDFNIEDIKAAKSRANFRYKLQVIANPDHTLVVKARTERREGNSMVSKEFSRQLTLPRDCLIERMTSSLSTDGVLTVEAPTTTQAIAGRTSPPPPQTPARPAPSYDQLNQSPSMNRRQNCHDPNHLQRANSPNRYYPAPSQPQPCRSGSPSRSYVGATTAAPGYSSGCAGSPRSASSINLAAQTGLPPSLFSPASRGVVAVNAEGDQVMQWCFGLEANLYTIDEIKVSVKGGASGCACSKLVVSALHEERTGGKTMRHEFSRECDLPESVDPRTLSTYYRPETGQLTVEARLRPEFQVPVGSDPRTRGVRLNVAFE